MYGICKYGSGFKEKISSNYKTFANTDANQMCTTKFPKLHLIAPSYCECRILCSNLYSNPGMRFLHKFVCLRSNVVHTRLFTYIGLKGGLGVKRGHARMEKGRLNMIQIQVTFLVLLFLLVKISPDDTCLLQDTKTGLPDNFLKSVTNQSSYFTLRLIDWLLKITGLPRIKQLLYNQY